MIRALLFLLAALLATTPALAVDTAPQPTQVDATREPQVTVYLAGESLSGIPQADIQILENGRPAQLTAMEHGSGPLHIVLVIDSSASMADAARRETATMIAADILQGLYTGDQAAIIAFGARSSIIQPLTADPTVAIASLRRLRPEGGTALYDAVADGVALVRDIPGRRAVFVIADGRDCRDDLACPAQFGSNRSLDEVAAEARNAGVPIYAFAVDPSASTTGSRALHNLMKHSASELPAAATGLYNTDIHALIHQIHSETALSYLSPRAAGMSEPRAIQITVGGAPPEPVGGKWIAMTAAIVTILAGAYLLRRRPRDIVAARPAAIGPTIQLGPSRMFCVECGRPVRQETHYCAHCGAPRS